MMQAPLNTAQAALFPRVRLTPGEVQAFKRRPPRRPSEWSEENRWVTDGPWAGGPWSNENTPYLVEPMDTWAMPHVRKIVVVAVPQSGKSQIIYNCWGFGVSERQAMSMMVLSDKDVAGNVAVERMAPIIESSPGLAPLMTTNPKDLGREKIRLQGSLTLMAWASSIAKLATFAIEHMFLDEVDDYPSWKPTQRHANPIARAEARTTTYRYTGKVLEVSTTSTESGPIWQELMKCQVIMVFGARCPHCGGWQIMRRDQLKWDESMANDPDRVESEGLCWYECEHCDEALSEAARRQAARMGSYRPHRWVTSEEGDQPWWEPIQDDEVPADPVSVGFHYSAFYSPFVPMARIAAQAIRAETDPAEEHDLYNRFLALPFRHQAQAKSEDHILRLCDERPPGLVPPASVALSAFVDVQRAGFWFTIRAWAPGPNLDSWLIRHGYLPTWQAVEKVLFEDQYKSPAGEARIINLALVDSGDGERTDEIYAWCFQNPPALPSKGREQLTQPFRQSPITSYPGLHLVNINTTHYKNALSRKLMIAPGDPGCWWLHTNHAPGGEITEKPMGLLMDYARHMCAETTDEKGRWIKIRPRNDLWDCEVGQLVCADLMGIRFLATEPQAQTKNQKEPATATRRKRW